MSDETPAEQTPEEFEEKVAALLQVDPKGIIGQSAKKKDSEDDEGPAS